MTFACPQYTLITPQELAKELTDPNQFGRRGEAWVFAQLAAIALIIFPPIPLQVSVLLASSSSCLFDEVLAAWRQGHAARELEQAARLLTSLLMQGKLRDRLHHTFLAASRDLSSKVQGCQAKMHPWFAMPRCRRASLTSWALCRSPLAACSCECPNCQA